MSEIINETINELNKPTPNNIFSIEDDPVTILEKINQVERYLKQIDTHVDTGINTANEALEKANSAFEANGTLVKINGENQTTWSADFAESERQKSKNLFDENKYISRYCTYASNRWTTNSTRTGYNQSILTDEVGATNNRDTSKLPLFKKGTYTLTMFNAVNNTNDTAINIALYNQDGTINGTFTTVTITTNTTITFTLASDLYLDIRVTGDVGTISFDHIQVEKGSIATAYYPYSGAIVHQGDIAPVVLYDQSSQNVFFGTAYPVGIPTQTEITSGVDFSPYKKLKVYYTHNEQYFGCTDIDLTKQTFGAEGGNGTWCCLSDDGNAICAATFQVKTNSFKCTANGFTKLSPLAYNNRPTTTNNTYYIYRIEGIK